MPWKLPELDADLLALAKGYPYEAPTESYLYRDGRTFPISQADFVGRTPVIGHGSNRAPSQLRRKYGNLSGRQSEIPVTLAWLHGYDIVYSAHVTRYGAIASTLCPAPGCRVVVAINWLDSEQLAFMHRTEGFYSYGSLRGVDLRQFDGQGPALSEAFVYRGDHGCLLKDGAPVGLAASWGENRPHRKMSQAEALALVHARHGFVDDLDGHILATIRDEQARLKILEALGAEALHQDWPHFHLTSL
ncbi:hypothetical protein [Limibacillus halophilus]|uniref:Uncharacterized protein n=1 Tax=Limibacillus halophilus TaxID=1579333 RepID=A0A839T0N9_9PROT|nr:hypothetical protein [Limibacillus halophilus]MBB3066713.1 hypothetical protein [Limibacillus halophilus]